MKKENISQIISHIDEKYIDEATLFEIEHKSEKALSDGSISDRKLNQRLYRLPRIATVAIVLICVLTLGGAAAWAMTGNFAFRDFFFKNSEKEFENLYVNEHREFPVGDHKLVFEGSIYDEAVEEILLNFSVWDAQGQPVELDGNLEDLRVKSYNGRYYELYPNYFTETTATWLQPFRLKNDVWGLLVSGTKIINTLIEDNNIFFVISRFTLDTANNNFTTTPEWQDFRFTVLNADEIDKLNEELMELARNRERDFYYDQDTQRWTFQKVDYDSTNAEITRILNDYHMTDVNRTDELTSAPAQVIQLGNFKLTIGRMNLVMEYRESERTIESFTLIREDGTRTEFKLDEEYCDSAHNPTDTRVNWLVDGVEGKHFRGGGAYVGEGIKLIYGYGFILRNDEKVTIEANGKTYQ